MDSDMNLLRPDQGAATSESCTDTADGLGSPLSLYQAALRIADARISIIPIRAYNPARPEDGDKKPAVSWKAHQSERASRGQVENWFKSENYGIGVVCGAVSDNLMMLELEGRAQHHLPTIQTTITDAGLTDLWARICQGAWEQTPSGGYHWYVRLELADGETLPRNQKLARRPATEAELEEDPTDPIKVLAETRGEGGYSVVAPTDGRFHENGRPWEVLTGTVDHAATITLDEWDTITSIFRIIDQMPAQPEKTFQPRAAAPVLPVDPHAGISPGDDFEAKTPWADILTPHGWTPVQQSGNEVFWCRPGKNSGISASTGAAEDRDRLWVWSTSTIFDSETPYTKFGAFALLEHGGDHSAAAKHLAERGFGKQAEHVRDTTGLDAFIRNLPTTAGATALKAVPDADPAPVITLEISEPDTYTRTDDGNALRFQDAYAHRLKYIPDQNTWAAWNGHKWDSENGDAVAAELARTLARDLPEDDKADEQHKRRSLSKNGILNMLTLARTSKQIYAPLPTFDADPYILNTPSGPVDLRTGKITPPNPERRLLRSTTIAPDIEIATPRWNKFLAETFTNDRDLIQYTQRLLGLALIGKVHEQILPFFHGAGANGKSTMLNVIQHILGTGRNGYTITVPADIFLASASNRHPADIAALAGARIAVTSETEEGQKFAEARVKLLTGSDNISARFMGQDFFTFTPSHSFFLLSNHEPEVNSGGSAFWRRVRKLPFLNIVPEQDRDPHLESKLLDEAPGILAWIIQGTRDYLARGMEEPEAVKVATRAYELDQDTLRQFIKEQCTLGDPNQQHMQIAVADFRSNYENWCRINGLDPVGSKTLTQRLRAHGVESAKLGKGIRYYTGIRINPEWDTSASTDDGPESAWDQLGGGR